MGYGKAKVIPAADSKRGDGRCPQHHTCSMLGATTFAISTHCWKFRDANMCLHVLSSFSRWFSMFVFLFTLLKVLPEQLWCAKVASVTSDSFWPYGLQPTRLLCPWDSPGKNTGVHCHALLWGSSPPRDWTWVFCCGQIVYCLSHHGSLNMPVLID